MEPEKETMAVGSQATMIPVGQKMSKVRTKEIKNTPCSLGV
jgi:hypothetical protein